MEGPPADLPAAGPDLDGSVVVPALFEGLLLSEGTVASARDASRAWYGDLVGPLLVPAAAMPTVQAQLAAGEIGLRVVLVAGPAPGDPAGLVAAAAARDLLLDDDRLELAGVHVRLPVGAPAGDVAEALLAQLDFTVPSWVEVFPGPGWEAALAVLAADGAERLALRLPPDDAAPGPAGAPPGLAGGEAVAAVLRRAVDLGLAFRVTGAGDGAASTLQVVAAERRPRPLAAALRGTSDADAAAARWFLDGVVVPDAQQTARDLAALGLVDPHA